jgi:hypothetical protein
MKRPASLIPPTVLLAAALVPILLVEGLSPSPSSASEGPPPSTAALPAADSAADALVDRAAPVITIAGGADAQDTLTVSWQPSVKVPAGATTIELEAAVTTAEAEERSFAVLVDGRGPDEAGDVMTLVTNAGRPTTVRLSVSAPAAGTTVSLGWSGTGRPTWHPVPASSLVAPVGETPGARAGLACGNPLTGDRDHDLIPDDLERRGYALVDSSIVAWRDDLAGRGYAKYVSDPNHCRSARDPYTDFEKVFGMMPGGTRAEARDPLVAAAPVVGVDLEKLIVTHNDIATKATTRTIDFSTTNSSSRTLGGKLGVEGGGSKGKPGEIKASGEFNFSWTRSHSVTDGSSTSWQEASSRKLNEAASLNGNVRYHNAGSAPVFNAHPTTNWVLEGEHTMASFRAGPNFRADALGAGESYPARGASALSVETINDAGTVALTVTDEELTALGRNGEVTLDTPQTSGSFGRVEGGRLDPAAGEWGPVLAGVRESTATLVLDAGPDTAQRHVAAPDLRDPDDTTPRLTLREAVDRAFAVETIDGRRYHRSPDLSSPAHRDPILLDEGSVLLTMDEATSAAVADQRRDGRSVYDVELRRGMHIGIKPAESFEDFDKGGFPGWTGQASTPGTVRPAGSAEIAWTKTGLTPGHRYRITFRSKNSPTGSSSTMWLDDANVPLDRAPTPADWSSEPTYVEFTPATTSVRLHGRAEIDDFAFFSLGASRRADTTWVSRSGEDLSIPDTTAPVNTQVDVLDRGGNKALDLVLSRDGRALDLSRAQVRVSGPSLGEWSTPAPYKVRGHVNLPVKAQGTSTLAVYLPREGSTAACDYCLEPVAVLSVAVGASRPATVDFYYKQGASKHMCTIRLRALETPGFRGDVAESTVFRSSSNSCENDDAYYLKFQNLPVGTELSVFDSPDASRTDDYFIWETKTPSSGLLALDPRERPAEVTVREQSYRNGLLGKVSRAEVHYPGTW